MDPTFFHPFIIYAWKIISFFKMQSYFLSYIRYAESKKMQYDSIEQMFNSYRKHKVFSKFSDKDLLLFVKSLIVKKDNKVHLLFNNKWDAHIYRTGLLNDMFIWNNIQKLKTKTLIIKAEFSDVFFQKTARLVLNKNNSIDIKTIFKSDHLFPINNSKKTMEFIRGFLD